MTGVDTCLVFNFGYVKRLAKPGSWRRGYDYYKQKQVQSLALTETGVAGQVKGNYKDAYSVGLTFEKEAVTPACDCPLEEPWCKHAVSVALTAIEQGLWFQFWGEAVKPSESKASDEGFYQFWLAPGKAPKVAGLRIVERESGKPVSDVEQVLRAAVALQSSGQQQFSDDMKREFNILQLPLKLGLRKSPDGWYHIPLAEVETLIKALQQVHSVCDANGNPLRFESTALRLQLSINVSMAGNVLLSLHWLHDATHDAFPLDDLTMFGRDIPWGIRKGVMYPLANTLRKLPHHITRSSFTDIRDGDGGRFMYEELPKLRDLVDIDEAEILEQLRLERKPPEKILTLELLDAESLRIRASLDFAYDGVKVAYSKVAPDTPYVMVIKKETETIYWVKRDLKKEQAAYQVLVDGHLEPMQMNFLSAEGDDAIDVMIQTIPQLGADWTIDRADDFSVLKVASEPLVICATIDFADTMDQFDVSLSARIGSIVLSLEDVQQALVSGKKYYHHDEAGYAEIPLANMLQLDRTFMAFDAEPIAQDAYRIQTYRVGLVAELQDQGVQLELLNQFAGFWERLTSFTTVEQLPIPANIKAELRTYQKQGFYWLWFLYSYGLNGILADDMGLGKTLQTLVVLQQAKNQDGPMPSLIVCPTSVVFNWVNECRRFAPDLSIINLTGPNRHGLYRKVKESDVVITSYALLRRDITALKNYPFRYVILDESQNIKNQESQTAQASKELQAGHRLALSGTPIENRLMELWSIFDFLMPGFLYDQDEFRQRFTLPIEEKGNRDAERRLKKQVYPFILRRLKRDVAKDLPPKIEQVLYCELTDAQQELYLSVLEKTKEEVFAQFNEKGQAKNQMSIFAALLRLRQICCHPRLMGSDLAEGIDESGKFEALQDHIEEIISEGHRVLLFSQFVEMLKIIRGWLDKKGIRYEYLTGETPQDQREASVGRFNRDDSIPLFLISLKAGGTGLNLTGADYVIHYDPWWNPAAEDQATDRAHRIGQTRTVFVYRFIARGTVEEKIMKLKEQKRDLVDSIIAADRTMAKSLSLDDLKDILTPDF